MTFSKRYFLTKNLKIKHQLFFRTPVLKDSVLDEHECVVDAIPETWSARKVTGSNPRELPPPATDTPSTPDLVKRLRDLYHTPPPVLLPPIRLSFDGTPDVPWVQAEDVACGETLEEERGEELMEAGTPEEQAAGQHAEAEQAREDNLFVGAEDAMGGKEVEWG